MSLPSRAQDAVTALEDLRLASDRRLAGIGLALLLVPAVWFIRTDIGDWARLPPRLLLRAALIVLPSIGYVVMRTVKTRADYSRAVLSLALSIAALTLVSNAMRLAGSGLPLRGPLLVLSIMYFAMPDTLVRQCLAPIGLSLGLIALRTTWLSTGGSDVPGDVISIGAFNALGVLAVRRRVKLEAATSTVVGELKTLRGIIPICSHCRKLRSEVGDWQQIEQYFRERSDTLFSHGICPDCLTSVYRNENLKGTD